MIVAIGSASFGMADEQPLSVLRDAGCTLRPNPHGRKLSEAESIALAHDADGWIAGSERVSRAVLDRCPRLRAVARIGVGLDTVDLEAARERGIAVSTTPDAPTDAVAEATVGALLALTRHLVPTVLELRAGRWTRRLGTGLGGLPVLIVGHGRIGRRTAELLWAFGAQLRVCDPRDPDGVPLVDGLRASRVVILHASGPGPILDEAAFAAMNDGTLVLNAARGALIDEAALAGALRSGRVGGCWLDVFGEEPYSGPLLAFEQVLATPHAATFTHECRVRMEVEAAENLLRDLRR
jgi:D-3-phosphoglycerate dehydrogenase